MRQIALSQFKNHAVDNFKQTKNNQEKEHCKNLLITTYLNEKCENVSKQVAQCIAKLARKEWPSNWNLLFEILVSNIKKDDANCVLITCRVIRDILEEISSMRLPLYQQSIHKLSIELTPILFEIWTKAFTFSFSQFESQQNCDLNKLYQCLKLCLLLSQSIKVLIKRASSIDFTNNSIGGQYLTKSLDVIQKLHDRYYVQLASHKDKDKLPLKNILKCMGEILKSLLTTVRAAHEKFTLQFRLILPSFLSYYTHLIIRHRKNRQRNLNEMYLNEVIVNGLLFLCDVCKFQQYEGKNISGIQFNIRGNGGKVEFNQQDANECKMIVTHFFNKDRLTNIIQCLVSDLFILNRKDLEDRAMEPCEKWKEHHIEHNNDNIRAAAKQLFRVLVKKYTKVCAPVIVEMFKSITRNNKENNINLINTINYKQMDPENENYKHFFLKEAVYLAFGLKYWDISPYLNELGLKFTDIGQILTRDLKLYGHDGGYKIPFLATRVIWLFGELKDDINSQKDSKQFAYNAILKHLQPLPQQQEYDNNLSLENEILLMRLISAEALYKLLDDTGFEASQYQYHLQGTFGLLLKLVQDCDASLECMQDVLRYISCTIKQNAETLSGECKNRKNNDNNNNINCNNEEIVNSIFESMGIVWESCNSTETNLCRVNLINCITHLIGCMKSINVHKLYPKLIPMISYCTESINDDSRICLNEHGLELWHKVLYHSYKLEKEMDKLFSNNWIPQMKTNADFFDVLMGILKSYLFLGGGNFVQNHAQDIGNTLKQIVPDITQIDDSFSKVTDVLCVFVQLFPTQSPEFLFSIIEHLVQDFLQTMSKENDLSNGNDDMKNNNNNNNDINDQLFMPTYITNLRIECYMLFFCRLLLANCDGTLKVLESIQQKQNNNNIIKSLFQCMFSAKDRVKQFYKQKIVALGLLKIYGGVTTNDTNLIIPLMSQLLSWFLYVIKETEIENLEFADDVLPEMDETNNSEWTEADRISNLYCNDMVSHTFMIDILQKTLINSCKKLNISIENLLSSISQQQSQKNNNIITDTKYCIDKYDQYLKNKQDLND